MKGDDGKLCLWICWWRSKTQMKHKWLLIGASL